MPRRIDPHDLLALWGTRLFPRLIDVRREERARASGIRAAGSVWRHHRQAKSWLSREMAGRAITVYCAHGHNVSEIAAAELSAGGADVSILAGGLDGWIRAGGPTIRLDTDGVDLMTGTTAWVTRERPKIDRVACPWLIRRFIDPDAVFHYVGAEWVADVAEELDAVPYDVEGVRFSHRGERCSFDAMIEDFGIEDAALAPLAAIVRGADTARFDLSPQAAGLAAVSFGLSAAESDDLRQLEAGITLYDALYAWCRYAHDETHNWRAA